MNQPLCVVDQRPVHDGGQLCAACWADLRADFAELPELVHDLERVLAGLTKTGGSPIGIVVRTAERGIGFDERAGDLLRQLHNTLGGWVRVLCEDNALLVDVANRIADLARWLGEHEREIRRHEAAGELWAEVHELTERARYAVLPRGGSRAYLGVCSAPLNEDDDEPELCDEDLYAPEGRSTVKCPKCWVTHQVAERRAVMLTAMRGEKLTAAECTRAFAGYRGVELTLARIGMWARRRRIYQHPPREGERSPRYRVAVVRLLIDRAVDAQAAGQPEHAA